MSTTKDKSQEGMLDNSILDRENLKQDVLNDGLDIILETCAVGVIGHVDHGKTTTTSMITKILEPFGRKYHVKARDYDEIDNSKEERQRGITIKQTTLEVYTPKRRYIITDCPGHVDYIKNMIAGVFQVDFVLLIVAANDLVNVQTEEHLLLASQIGLKLVVVYINKIDLLDAISEDERELTIAAIEEEVKSLIDKFGMKLVMIVKGSSLKAAEGDKKYLDIIKNMFLDMDNKLPSPTRNTSLPLLLFIEGVYKIPGRGTVISGRIDQGTLKIGDKVQLLCIKANKVIETIVTSIEMFKKSYTSCQAGDNVGILLRGLESDYLNSGDILCAPNSMKLNNKFKVKMVVLSEADGGRKNPFKSGYEPSFFIGTGQYTGKIILQNEHDEVLPGSQNIDATIEFPLKVGLQINSRVVFREGNKTVGFLTVTGILSDNSNDNRESV